MPPHDLVDPFDEFRAAMDELRHWAGEIQEAKVGAVLDNLMTTADIVRERGFASASTVNNWRARGVDFPPPVRRFARTDLYWRPSVEAWFEERERHVPGGLGQTGHAS